MKIKLMKTFVAAMFCASIAHAAPDSLALIAPTANDQIPQRVVAMTLARTALTDLDRSPSAMSWAIDPSAALDAAPKPFVQESREYWIDADGVDLQHGVNLATSAPGALIRLSPVAGNTDLLDPATFSIRANGRSMANADAIRTAADADALRAAGMDVPDRSVVIRLDERVGAGNIELVAASARGAYLIHVFEPASPIVLSLRADRDSVIAGNPIRFIASTSGGARIASLQGLVSSPGGHSETVDFERQADGSFVASVAPDVARAGGHGLWEIHAFGNTSKDTFTVQRDARNAFAVGVATARLDGTVERVAATRKTDALVLRVGVDAADGSRYQLAGVLYGTAGDGALRPAVVAHSAAWLDAGRGTIDLRIDSESLAKSGLRAPYEVRDLRLINQADMSLIERRERALVVR